MKTIDELLFIKSKLYNGIFSDKIGSIDTAIQALEENVKYRELQEMVGIPFEKFAELCRECIPDECKYPKKAVILTDEDVDKWQQCKAIDTVEDINKVLSFLLEDDNGANEPHEDLKLKYCYEDLSSAENRGYMQGYNEAIDEFAETLKGNLVRKYANANLTQQYVALQVTDWCNEIAEQMKAGGENE